MLILRILVASALVALPRSQSLQPTAAAAPAVPTVVPIHTAPDDPIGGRYGVRAAGVGYKASFHDGFAFIAMVGDGKDAPLGCSYRLRSCRVGDHEFARGGTPAMRHTDTRCEYDHGGVVEAYDVRADGVEQTFVLATRPATAGDLVLIGELRAAPGTAPWRDVRPRDGGLEFCAADGSVPFRYHAAVAIDARGERTAMTTSWQQGIVTHTLAAAWLEQAVWPIVVDPLLEPDVTLGLPQRVVAVDLLRDDQETSRNLWVATTVETNNGDRDLFVRRCDDDFQNGIDVFVDISTLWKTDTPHLAASGGERKVAAAFMRDFGTQRAVRWHLRDKDDVALSTTVGFLTPPAGSHDWQPCLGGTSAFAFGRHLLLLWQRDTAPTFQNTPDSRVFGAVLDTSIGSNGTLGTPFRVDARDDHDQQEPCVNQEAEGGQAFSWVAAWRADDRTSPNPFRVCARRIDNSGLFGNRFDAPLGLLVNGHGEPRLAGSGGRYLLVYGSDSHSGGFHELFAVRLDWPHGEATAVRPHPTISLEAGVPTNVQVDGVAFDTLTRCHWAVVRRDLTANTVRVSKVGFRSQVVEHSFVTLVPGHDATTCAIAFDDDVARFPLVVGLHHPTASQAGGLQFDAMQYDALGLVAEYGTACGSGRVRWNGSQHIGDEFTGLDVVQASPTTLTLLAVAAASAAVPLQPIGMPGCTLLVDALGPAALAVVPGVTDAGGRFVMPLPLLEHLAPLTLHAQAFQLLPGSNDLGLVATRGLVVPLGR